MKLFLITSVFFSLLFSKIQANPKHFFQIQKKAFSLVEKEQKVLYLDQKHIQADLDQPIDAIVSLSGFFPSSDKIQSLSKSGKIIFLYQVKSSALHHFLKKSLCSFNWEVDFSSFPLSINGLNDFLSDQNMTIIQEEILKDFLIFNEKEFKNFLNVWLKNYPVLKEEQKKKWIQEATLLAKKHSMSSDPNEIQIPATFVFVVAQR